MRLPISVLKLAGVCAVKIALACFIRIDLLGYVTLCCSNIYSRLSSISSSICVIYSACFCFVYVDLVEQN